MEDRFRRSALWIEARNSETAHGKSDDSVFLDILRRLKDEPSGLLPTVPHIDIAVGGKRGHGNKLTCGYCGVTVVAATPEKFAEFIILHAGCEGH